MPDDWEHRPAPDETPGLASFLHAQRAIALLELTPPQKALLRAAGEPVCGTCPVCLERDKDLVVVNGRETCRTCPWELGRELVDVELEAVSA